MVVVDGLITPQVGHQQTGGSVAVEIAGLDVTGMIQVSEAVGPSRIAGIPCGDLPGKHIGGEEDRSSAGPERRPTEAGERGRSCCTLIHQLFLKERSTERSAGFRRYRVDEPLGRQGTEVRYGLAHRGRIEVRTSRQTVEIISLLNLPRATCRAGSSRVGAPRDSRRRKP